MNFWEQDAYDWWYMYCYYEVMIYSNRMDAKNANATFGRQLDRALNKFSRTLSNTTMDILRNEFNESYIKNKNISENSVN